jgi:hypothetical protein
VPISTAPAAGTSGQHARPGWLSVRGGELTDVAARSSSSAYAVGEVSPDAGHTNPLVEYWNGAAWCTVSSAALPAQSFLDAVAAFPGGAWAVGHTGIPEIAHEVERHLIVRVSTTVRRVPVPGPARGDVVDVAATSASNAWAVGGTPGTQLLWHWNGAAWTRSPLPAGMGASVFTAVAASSATNAWAVTYAGRHLPPIMHWNGRRWGQVASPDIGIPYALSDVATTSAKDVFAVGSAPEGSSRALLMHWNGRSWTWALIHQPKYLDMNLAAVSASSADNAWAVGSYFDSAHRALALHWNGHTWKQVITPEPGQESKFLQGVAVIPRSGNAWTVGSADPADPFGHTLTLYWNGTAWR